MDISTDNLTTRFITLKEVYKKYKIRLFALFTLGVLSILPSSGVTENLCPFYLLTGHQCPFCGITRSMSSLLHFEFNLSLFYHPLGLLVLTILLYVLFSNSYEFLFKKISFSNKISITFINALYMIFAVFGIIRLIYKI